MSAIATKANWADLLPDEFRARRAACPIVYLPLGLCEPHGHVAALGLDLIKAEYYCREAARRFGGIVAPSQGYHIHECGFHAAWLAEVVGNEDAMMAALPPPVLLKLFLYQLRAFANAGFRAVIGVSGHAGGSEEDLRRVAHAFESATGLRVIVRTDPEWAGERYPGDHAGRYELSQLMAIRPDLVDLTLRHRGNAPGAGGRLALGHDAGDASAGFGHEINEAVLAGIEREVKAVTAPTISPPAGLILDYGTTERLWARIESTMPHWRSMAPDPTQPPLGPDSQWAACQSPLPIFEVRPPAT